MHTLGGFRGSVYLPIHTTEGVESLPFLSYFTASTWRKQLILMFYQYFSISIKKHFIVIFMAEETKTVNIA